jgi:6-phosphogluconolactonase
MFAALADAPFDWAKVHVFWVDERLVPPDHPQSNYGLARTAFLQPAGIPPQNIHRVDGELEPEEAARAYAEEIRRVFQIKEGDFPRFDVIHCGMGADAHTASLFPGGPLLDDRTNLCAPVWVEKLQSWRVTLLPGVLLAARCVVLFAPGGDKADALHTVLTAAEDLKRYPVQLLTRRAPHLALFTDSAGAAKIDPAAGAP